MKGHTSCAIQGLDLKSMKKKDAETNMKDGLNLEYEINLNEFDPIDVTYLDVSNFFRDLSRDISHLIGDGNVQTN